MSTTGSCARCHKPMAFRPRTTIADVLRGAALHCATEPADWCKRFLDLTARLIWVENELRGICTNCTLERVTQEQAIESGRLDGPPNPRPANVLHFRKRDLF